MGDLDSLNTSPVYRLFGADMSAEDIADIIMCDFEKEHADAQSHGTSSIEYNEDYEPPKTP